jgi:hypothetical protein
MKKLLTATALLIWIGAPAIAQTSNSGGSSTAVKDRPLPEAPVGHRQPRASDVPPPKDPNDPNDPLSKENALLDRKIKSICRGC